MKTLATAAALALLGFGFATAYQSADTGAAIIALCCGLAAGGFIGLVLAMIAA
jgi:hypothetical protein